MTTSLASATILVNPPAPYPQAEDGDTGFKIYYAANTTGANTVASSGLVNTARGYRVINAANSTADANLIWIDVKSTSSANTSNVVTLSVNTTVGSEVPLRGAGVVTSNTAPPSCSVSPSGCQGTSFKSAKYSTGNIIRLAFSLADLCAAGGSGTLCTGSAYSTISTAGSGQTLEQTVYVTFGAADISTGVGPVTGGEQISFTLGITSTPPAMPNCPSTEAQYYFPGDGQIYLKNDNFAVSANGGVGLQNLLFMAKPGTAADTTPGVTTNPIVSYTDIAGQPEITGFSNEQDYGGITYAQNIAGIVNSTASACLFSPIRSRAIKGVLAESKCFIATAAFQDGRAAPVMMLRKFRDQILSKFHFGREFINTYYQYSPALAEWAWDKPIVRSVALRVLAPVEFMAWAWLKISEAQTNTGSNQPYIDRLKKELGNDESSAGYSEREKQKLEPEPTPSESYITQEKKLLEAEESSEGYSQKQKAELPPETERESPIKLIKSGRDRKLTRGDPKEIKNAISFKLGVSPGMEVTGGANSFSDVYDPSWKPDFIIHYERQFLRSENFGSLSLGVDLGLNYAGGYGLFDTPFNNSRKSITKFTFIQAPLIVNAYYRFNLARLIRPYVGAGLGAMGYGEFRTDQRANKYGYAFIYTTSVGASLLLDFFDSSTARDSYLSNGVQHTYLFVEYMYLNTFKSDVFFQRAGIYSGFLFEI